MMSREKNSELFDDDEAKRRFEAALRGSREVQAHPMKDIPLKRVKKERNQAQRPGSKC